MLLLPIQIAPCGKVTTELLPRIIVPPPRVLLVVPMFELIPIIIELSIDPEPVVFSILDSVPITIESKEEVPMKESCPIFYSSAN